MPHSSLRAGGWASVKTTRPGGEHGAVVGRLIWGAIADAAFKSDLRLLAGKSFAISCAQFVTFPVSANPA
jgi:hypothetical protein